MSDLLSVYLEIRDLPVTILGASPAAAEAAADLAGRGARVRLVAADLSGARGAVPPAVELVEEEPSGDHARGCRLLVAASADPAVDAGAIAAAVSAGVPAVSLTGAAAPAHVGRSVHVGGLALSVTTRSRCPELEERLAQEAGRALVPELDAYAAILSEIRGKLAERQPDPEQRTRIWEQVLDSPVLALLQAGEEDEARELAERMAWGAG